MKKQQPWLVRLLTHKQFQHYFPLITFMLASTEETYWIAGIGFVIWAGVVLIDNQFNKS